MNRPANVEPITVADLEPVRESPSIIAATALYDERDEETGELRVMRDFEQTFLDAVDKIRWERIYSYQAAERWAGDLPRDYRNLLLLADKRCQVDLAAALKQLEADREEYLETA
jgi:hypothetical protein